MDVREPHRANSHAMAAAAMLEAHRYDTAETEALVALAADPHLVLAHHVLALSMAARHRWTEARHAIDEALRHGPSQPELQRTLAGIQYQQGQVRESEATVQTAISLEPQSAESQRILAEILLEQMRLPEALRAAAQGLALDPNDPALFNVEALVLARLGRFDEAQAAALSGLEIAPDSPFLQNAYGLAVSLGGDPMAARERYREAARLNPDMEAAVHNVKRMERLASGQGDESFVRAATTSDRLQAATWWWARRSLPTRASILLGGLVAGIVWPIFWMFAASCLHLELARFAQTRLSRPWHPPWRRNLGFILGNLATLPVVWAIPSIAIISIHGQLGWFSIVAGIALSEPIAFTLARAGRTRVLGAGFVTLAIAVVVAEQSAPTWQYSFYIKWVILLVIMVLPYYYFHGRWKGPPKPAAQDA